MLKVILRKLNLPIELSKLILAFFSANLFGVFVQTISGLLVARMVMPEQMGFLSTATIATTFIPFLLIGTNNGLNRQLPFLIGQGKKNEVEKLRDTAFAWAFLVSVIVLLVILIIGINYYTKGNSNLGLAFFSIALSGSFYPITAMLEISYRTNSDFIKLSKIKFVGSLFALATVPLVFYFTYNGLLIRSALIAFFGFSLLYFYKTVPFKLNFYKEQFFDLLKIGVPIFFWSYLYSLYVSLDKIFVAKYFTNLEMGLLTPAVQITAGLSILPNSLFQIMYPKLCTRYGETNSIKSLEKLIMVPLKYLAIGLIPIFALAIILVDPFVTNILPNYKAGITTAQWAIVAVYFRCLGGGQDVLTVVSKLKYYGIITILSACIFFVVFKLLLLGGVGLEAITISFSVSMLCFNLMVYFVIKYLVIKEERSLINGLV